MTLFRSFLFSSLLAVSVSISWLDAARADEAKPTTPVPVMPDLSKDKPLPDVFAKKNPDGIGDLKVMETHVKGILEKVIPCTVCVQVGDASGSGVIVSEDGVILTAGHVSGKPGQKVEVIMPDGKHHKGITLGNATPIDSGMIKITDEGKYPFVELGKSADLKKDNWCITVGHPGGYKPGRSPVVRVGRILEIEYKVPDQYIRTDCTLVGGDSGGPLFDMHGRLIGIHSRIGGQITSNMHVPVDTYRETWERLVSSEVFNPNEVVKPYFGFMLDQVDMDCKIVDVVKDSPAAKAGFKMDDVIKKFDGKDVADVEALRKMFDKKKPNDEVKVEILRGEEKLTITVKVGKQKK